MAYLLIIFVVLILTPLILLLLKILPLLTAKPTISVDYIAEYNKLTKPPNYNSNDNAAPYYQKALEALVDIPEDIKEFVQAWPGDMNETELNVLQTWLSSNSDSLRYLKEASRKPYCWFQRQSADKAIFDIEPFELSKLGGAIWCFSLEAKLSAYQGNIDRAFDHVHADRSPHPNHPTLHHRRRCLHRGSTVHRRVDRLRQFHEPASRGGVGVVM